MQSHFSPLTSYIDTATYGLALVVTERIVAAEIARGNGTLDPTTIDLAATSSRTLFGRLVGVLILDVMAPLFLAGEGDERHRS